LRLAGAMKVAEGLTTLDEVLRNTPSLDASRLGLARRCAGPCRRVPSRYVETTAGSMAALLECRGRLRTEETAFEDQEPEGLLVRG
jgi:hypothetical protein